MQVQRSVCERGGGVGVFTVSECLCPQLSVTGSRSHFAGSPGSTPAARLPTTGAPLFYASFSPSSWEDFGMEVPALPRRHGMRRCWHILVICK